MASLTTITAEDIDRIRTSVFIEPPVTSRSSTRFWVLLVLASVIASAGVVADSTATVIGAMIVAPLMTPILGIALAVVLADRPHLLRSLVHVVLGASRGDRHRLPRGDARRPGRQLRGQLAGRRPDQPQAHRPARRPGHRHRRRVRARALATSPTRCRASRSPSRSSLRSPSPACSSRPDGRPTLRSRRSCS